jgi:hypothetical protein
MVQDWIKTVWNKRPGTLLQLPALLVWNSFCRAKYNKTTFGCEDQCGHYSWRSYTLSTALGCIHQQTIQGLPTKILHGIDGGWGHDLTPAKKIKRPSLEMLCDWILTAWNMIMPEIIVKSFLKQASLTPWMGGKMTLFGLMVRLTMYTRKALWR